MLSRVWRIIVVNIGLTAIETVCAQYLSLTKTMEGRRFVTIYSQFNLIPIHVSLFSVGKLVGSQRRATTTTTTATITTRPTSASLGDAVVDIDVGAETD